MLCQELKDVATNKVMAALVVDTQDIYNAERVVRDDEAVIFHN